MYVCICENVEMYVAFTYLQYEPPFCFVMHVPPFLQPTDKHDEPASYMKKYNKKNL